MKTLKILVCFVFGVFSLGSILMLTNNVIFSKVKSISSPVILAGLSRIGIEKRTIHLFFSRLDPSLYRMIEQDCCINLKKDSPEKIVLALRDFVFRTTIRGPTPKNIVEPSERYLFAHYTPPLQQVCSGYATEFRFLLQKAGIDSREVVLAAPSYFKGRTGDTHAALEVFVNNKWVFMDPTFNCHWHCSNGSKMLSLQEIHACINSGNKLVIQEGKSRIPKYALKEYYIDFQDFIYAYKTVGTDGNFGNWKFFKFIK